MTDIEKWVMESLAKKLLDGKDLIYVYNDGSSPHYMKNWHFMGIYNGMARFYYGDGLGYEHEVNISRETLFKLQDKGFVRFSYGTLKYLH